MDKSVKIGIIKNPPIEEILTEKRLEQLLESKKELKHYIGFEISGYVHLGTGLLCMSKVADLQRAGIKTTIFLADFHSWINNKLGGDLNVIQRVGGGYFKEALKQSLRLAGGNPDEVEFILGSQLYERGDFLKNMIKLSLNMTLSRVKRSITIMGRSQKDSISFGQLLYVPMQVADIFTLGVDITHGGMDQRKAHVIAIDIGEKAFGYKPVAIHHHLLIGMHINEEIRQQILSAKQKGDREQFEQGIVDIKMSKSQPNSAIFIHDTPNEIQLKIKKAFCPIGEIELNPILELCKYIIFKYIDPPLIIKNKKTNEAFKFVNYEQLENAFSNKKVHPLDLKMAVADELIKILQPSREYFLTGKGNKYLNEMKNILL